MNYQLSLRKLYLCLKMEEQADRNTVFGYAIYNACCSHQLSCEDIIRWVKSQAEDNVELMSTILTPELVQEILEI